MPETYKLIYFNARGMAEPSRLILSYAGVPFEDTRIERADWPAMKPSKSICNYLPKIECFIDIAIGFIIL